MPNECTTCTAYAFKGGVCPALSHPPNAPTPFSSLNRSAAELAGTRDHRRLVESRRAFECEWSCGSIRSKQERLVSAVSAPLRACRILAQITPTIQRQGLDPDQANHSSQVLSRARSAIIIVIFTPAQNWRAWHVNYVATAGYKNNSTSPSKYCE